MYIQPPFSVPKGYSGNAFPNEGAEEMHINEEATQKEGEEVSASPEEIQKNEADEKEAQDACAVSNGNGIFSRFPFLPSLLPPPRHKKEKGSSLSEWVIVGIFLFLIMEDNDQDLLPFLLLLLLWD